METDSERERERQRRKEDVRDREEAWLIARNCMRECGVEYDTADILTLAVFLTTSPGLPISFSLATVGGDEDDDEEAETGND